MKSKKTTAFLLSLILLSSLIWSCSKNRNIKPIGKLQLQFKTINHTLLLGSSPNIPNTKNNLEWNGGFMNVSSVSIDSTLGEIEGKSNSEANSYPEPKDTSTIINFFIPNQKFLNVNIAPGSYSNVKIRVDIAQTLTAPALFLKGKFTNSKGVVIPIEFSLNEGNINANDQQNGEHQNGNDDGLELEMFTNKLNVDTQNITTATINLDFKLLFAGISASNFETTTLSNGVIVINKTKNIPLYNLIKASIKKFSKN